MASPTCAAADVSWDAWRQDIDQLLDPCYANKIVYYQATSLVDGIGIKSSFQADSWQASLVSPWALTSWMICFMLTAASQPTGRILHLPSDVQSTPPSLFTNVLHFRRYYRLHSLDEIGRDPVHTLKPHEAATIALASRLPGDIEQQIQEIVSMKSGAATRMMAFITGVLPSFIKLCFCDGVALLQVFGSMYVGPWIAFELLIWACTPEMSSLASTDVQDTEPDIELLRKIGAAVAYAVQLGLDLWTVVTFTQRGWLNVMAAGTGSVPHSDVLLLLVASALVILWVVWGAIASLFVGFETSAITANDRRIQLARRAYTGSGALLLGTAWIPLLVLLVQSLLSGENEVVILASGLLVGVLTLFSVDLIFRRSDRAMSTASRSVMSLVLHIFINYQTTSTHQPPWLVALG